MRRLLLDIETAPNIAHIWGMFNQNIAPKQVLATGYTLCWAAKWYGKREVFFSSIHADGEDKMVQAIWNLLDEADAVVHYNGTRFDIPTLQKEFIRNNLSPPKPYHQIDLLKTVRREFRFHSNKLDEVLKALDMKGKVEHKGHELWIECMAGDEKAWRVMERYNKQDVRALEPLYNRLRPWIKGHPNFALYTPDNRILCNICGSSHVQSRGTRTTRTMTYEQFQCMDCGKWLRGRTNNLSARKKDWILTEA